MKLFISTLALATGITTAAHAADPIICMSAPEMEATLIDWYGEQPVEGSTSEQEQLWVSDKTGTWTMIEYRNNGEACVLAQGDDWLASQNLLLAEFKQ